MRWLYLLLIPFALEAQGEPKKPVVLKGGAEMSVPKEMPRNGGRTTMFAEDGKCPEAANGWVLFWRVGDECYYWHEYPSKGQPLPPVTPDGRGGPGKYQKENAPSWEVPEEGPEPPPAGPGDPRLYRPANSVPGGYDPCKNPVPPLACKERQNPPPPQQQQRQQPPSNYFQERAERTEGFKQGLRDCIDQVKALPGELLHISYDVGYASYLAGIVGDYEGAGKQLGLERIPQAIAGEFTHPTVGATPYEQGRRMAQRLCGYGVAPQFAKGAGKFLKKGTGPGSSAFKPMKAKDVGKSLRPSGGVPSLRAMEGNWVDLGGGPVELGKLRGAGSFGAVYDVASGPGAGKQVVKLAREGDVRALRDQFNGYQDLKANAPGVGTPEIRGTHWGNNDIPANIVMDDAAKSFRTVAPKSGGPTGPFEAAVRRMNTDLGKGDLVWVDGHAGNVFFYRDAGGVLKAGAMDTDMMYRSINSNLQRDIVRAKEQAISSYLKSQNIPIANTRPPALGFMQAMNRAFWPYGF